jgi:sirohydrochlorin cobaltochelatase
LEEALMQKQMVIVLAMHGVPPSDFPRPELEELLALHARFEHAARVDRKGYERYEELETKIRYWPRTEDNDPYHAASLELGRALSDAAGCEVLVGFNEFCAPGLDETLDRAAGSGAGTVLVVTPMMTQGGEHSERDIPSAISRARERHPGRRIVYAWPFPIADVAGFLAGQALQFVTPDHA